MINLIVTAITTIITIFRLWVSESTGHLLQWNYFYVLATVGEKKTDKM